jgi:hypothetical protein
MKLIKYSLFTLLVFLAMLFSALLAYINWLNRQHYKDLGEFKIDIDAWNITGSSSAMAINKFQEQGFKCSIEHSILGQKTKNSIYIMCYRDLPGFPCDQRLQVWLSLGAKHLVDDIVILQSHEQLPAQCL